jgi:hypothetical protein
MQEHAILLFVFGTALEPIDSTYSSSRVAEGDCPQFHVPDIDK